MLVVEVIFHGFTDLEFMEGGLNLDSPDVAAHPRIRAIHSYHTLHPPPFARKGSWTISGYVITLVMREKDYSQVSRHLEGWFKRCKARDVKLTRKGVLGAWDSVTGNKRDRSVK